MTKLRDVIRGKPSALRHMEGLMSIQEMDIFVETMSKALTDFMEVEKLKRPPRKLKKQLRKQK